MSRLHLPIPAGELIVLFALISAMRVPSTAFAAEKPLLELSPAAETEIDFVKHVEPILRASCLSCHGAEAEEGGLRLDIQERVFAGGDSGKAILPGESAKSRLVHLLAGVDDELGLMPPEGEGTPLSAEQIGLIRAWIDQGANWPEEAFADARQKGADHWSFQPIVRPEPPAPRGMKWVKSPIDAFVLARLQQEGISPSPEADKATLLRRVYLDLLGLPPSPAEVEQFMADKRGDAYERLVDRLLRSPHYGERWGRHWLDLARYADSDGYEKDRPRPNAWRYRDWVIFALNDDMPFDEFTIKQIAGDMLADASPDDRVASGFHRNTLHNTEGGIDQEEDRVKKTVDRTNTVGAVWLGLTVGCAECHSHKYDPLTQREYYSLYAFFNSMNEVDANALARSEQLAGQKSAKDSAKAQAVAQLARPRPTRIHIRGDFLNPGEAVPAGTPGVLPPIQPRVGEPDRLDLARWLVDPANPLTARVTVNRIWQRYFGRGLVATPDDFGLQGERPSHAELLDWLASELIDGGWRLKHVHRLIVTSATYRQSSAARNDLIDVDPENVLLARQTRRRVEAEVVRDLALAASGLLHPKIGGPSVRPPQPAEHAKLTYANSAKWEASTGGDRYRRGLYTFFQRTSPYPMLMTFDSPDSNECTARRASSNTPLQALTLWNDPVFVECAQALGRRIMSESGEARAADETVHRRIRYAFELCLARPPSDAELAILKQHYHRQLQLAEADPKAADALAGKLPIPKNTSKGELAAWVMLGRTLLNLDEFITKE